MGLAVRPCSPFFVVYLSNGYDHFGVAQHFIVEEVAFLHHVYHKAFLLLVGGGELGDGFVEVLVEFGALGFDGFARGCS